MAIYFGTPYDDYLYGWAGNDTLYGGAGNDSLIGSYMFDLFGDDYLIGEEGNDSLIGGEGNDTLIGGTGNDTLIGEAGNDTLIGGEGSDRFVYTSTYTSSTTFSPAKFGVDVISDFVSGTDQIHLQRAIFPSLSSEGGTGFSVADEFAIVTSDADASTSTADIVYNSVNGNLFYNSNGSDPGFGTGALFATLTGASPLVATDFVIEDGNDYVNGGTGDDTLLGGEGNDTLLGEAGNDTLLGGEGNDTLLGEAGNDTLLGGEGNDTLLGGEGNDTLLGGEGSDLFIYNSWTTFSSEDFGVDVISDFVSGTDQIHLRRAIFPNLSSEGGTGFSVAGEFAIVECDAQAATSTANIVYNSVNGNLFYNSNGSDPGFGTGALFATLTGVPPLVATDFVIEDGNDYVNGGTGDDTIDGGAGNDTIDGGTGNDSLIGRDGNDSLDGGTGNDSLDGGEGNDYLYDEAGDDILDGGTGNDTLNAGDGNDTLNGGDGNDTLYGEAGNDSLHGEAGNDSLHGGASNDTLHGGAGNDILIGGEGSDHFVYFTGWIPFSSENFGVDTISDFVTGTDKIDLSRETFTSLRGDGYSVAFEFAIVTTDAQAATSTADIVYNSVNGNLFYNPNGSDPGFGTGALFATLSGAPTLVATDFIISYIPLYD